MFSSFNQVYLSFLHVFFVRWSIAAEISCFYLTFCSLQIRYTTIRTRLSFVQVSPPSIGDVTHTFILSITRPSSSYILSKYLSAFSKLRALSAHACTQILMTQDCLFILLSFLCLVTSLRKHFQEHFKNKCVTRLMCLFSRFVSGCHCDFQGCRLSTPIEQ